jgi:hypothetical protein
VPRTKKQNTSTANGNTNSTEQILLSESEVYDVIAFAKSLASGVYPGIVTPDLINARMKDLSYSPIEASEDSLNKALKNPKESEQQLRSFIENFENISMPLKRIFSYLSSQLGYDYTYTCLNADSNYTKKPYLNDLNKFLNFTDRFDHKHAFRNVSRQLLRNELFICAIRDEGEKIVLQELPIERCKLTAKWDYGFLASFDFSYFLQSGVDISLFPRFFMQKFNELFGGSGSQKYNPHLPPELRGDSQYSLWVDLPPEVGWVFKFDTSLTTAVPYFTPLMKDLIDQPVMRSLQRNINMSTAARMVVGQVPMLKDTKASVKDMIAIDPKTLGQFMALVKSALSESIKVASAPLEDIKALSFSAENEVYDTYLRTALASSGMNTALLYTSQLKANAVESQLSFQSDSLIMEQNLYPQFNAFMNYFINKETTKYKFAIEFEGNDYYLDRQKRFENSMALADKGIFLVQKVAASIGMKPQTLIRMMEENKSNNYVDLLTPILSSFQMSGKPGSTDSGGRPQKSDSELGEKGSETRSQGSNLDRGGKV